MVGWVDFNAGVSLRVGLSAVSFAHASQKDAAAIPNANDPVADVLYLTVAQDHLG